MLRQYLCQISLFSDGSNESRRKRTRQHPEYQPWNLDGDNWFNELAKQINCHLKILAGRSWSTRVRGEHTIRLAVLACQTDPFKHVFPKHYCEWDSRESEVRACVHPNSDTFCRYFVRPMVDLLRSID